MLSLQKLGQEWPLGNSCMICKVPFQQLSCPLFLFWGGTQGFVPKLPLCCKVNKAACRQGTAPFQLPFGPGGDKQWCGRYIEADLCFAFFGPWEQSQLYILYYLSQIRRFLVDVKFSEIILLTTVTWIWHSRSYASSSCPLLNEPQQPSAQTTSDWKAMGSDLQGRDSNPTLDLFFFSL